MRKLIGFLLVLLVLVVILDRVAVTGVQREIATQATAKYDLSTPPEVTIEGIPFLTQAIAGRYEEVRVAAGAMTISGIRLSSVGFTLRGVTAPLEDLVLRPQQVDMRAERVEGTVVVPVETLNQRAPQGIKVNVVGDELNVSGEITVLGQKVPVKAALKVEIAEGGLRLVPGKVTLGGGIPVPDPERFINYRIPIGKLPYNLKLTEVKAVPEGLRISGEASDVPLRG
ncbi:LmeA family phospholipid-binding protein [Streptosporangium sp. V21-05]|uniref:LmeA family phospholipid-binding protein n=1 Tax=Streptosporangium sp. V21-05 TaxID=3446115 RepID=UPI003F5303A9